jgi:phosphoglycolate phosphatase
VDKATGLKEALTMLKAHAEQTVAIGDSETDIPMFDMCGYSIALCHAPDLVKSRAKHVVRGREGIGLVDALDFVTFNYLGLRFKNDISSFSE